VAAQEPGIMQCKDDRFLSAKPGQAAQIEIMSMQVMAVDNVHISNMALQGWYGARKVEIFLASPDIENPLLLSNARIQEPVEDRGAHSFAV
jgi:hypothetical protein